MKKKLLYIISAICLGGASLVSCSDYLDKEPDTELTTEMAFENRDKVYSWLSYVYNIIHTPDKWQLMSDGYEVFADDLTPSDHQLTVGWRPLAYDATLYPSWLHLPRHGEGHA